MYVYIIYMYTRNLYTWFQVGYVAWDESNFPTGEKTHPSDVHDATQLDDVWGTLR